MGPRFRLSVTRGKPTRTPRRSRSNRKAGEAEADKNHALALRICFYFSSDTRPFQALYLSLACWSISLVVSFSLFMILTYFHYERCVIRTIRTFDINQLGRLKRK